MKIKYKIVGIILLIIFVFMGIVTKKLWDNHYQYTKNIEELKLYNTYNDKVYSEKNVLISNKTLDTINGIITELKTKYKETELRIDDKNIEELYNLSLYNNL